MSGAVRASDTQWALMLALRQQPGRVRRGQFSAKIEAAGAVYVATITKPLAEAGWIQARTDDGTCDVRAAPDGAPVELTRVGVAVVDAVAAGRPRSTRTHEGGPKGGWQPWR